MRIDNQPITGITKAYTRQNKENILADVRGSSKNDQINLSSEARFFSIGLTALRQLPDSDDKNPEELKLAVKTGTYEVKTEELAEKILQECFLDQRV